MGMLRKINRGFKAERARTRAFKLSKEIQTFYGSKFVADWQRKRVSEIRALYEEKNKALQVAHDHASSRLSEDFMQFELDYLRTSNEFKETNPREEMPWAPEAGVGVMGKIFMKNLIVKSKALGLKFYGGKETTKA